MKIIASKFKVPYDENPNNYVCIDQIMLKQNTFPTIFQLKIVIAANLIPSGQVKIDHVKDLMTNIKARFESVSKTLNLSNFCEDESEVLGIEFALSLKQFFFVALQLYYPLYRPKTMLHVISFAASYTPKKLLLQNNYLKDANSIYPLNKTELIFLDLRNNQVKSKLY